MHSAILYKKEKGNLRGGVRVPFGIRRELECPKAGCAKHAVSRWELKFDSKELREYFNSKSWYHGTVNPEDFSESVFNSYEKKNIQFLAQREESMQKGGYKLDQ